MNFLRKHWYDLGGFFSLVLILSLLVKHSQFSDYQLLMWLSVASLFFHQLEEYRIVGTFPGMMNAVMYHSEIPDHYPLNTNSAFCVNVLIGWPSYLLAAVFAEKTIWLGLATILISLGNFIAHTFLFNIKGKTVFNPGMVTAWLFFAPCVYFFFRIVYQHQLITGVDYLIGIPLGIMLNVVGVLKMIDWLADKNSPYVFDQRNLVAKDRISV